VSRILYVDCAAGASGDMLLGALVDLGLSLEALSAELARVPLHGYHLQAQKVTRCGLAATKVDVVLDHHDHHHRGLHDILGLLEASTLPEELKARAGKLFRRLAEAEGAVHGVSPETVHFHEVGAVDSIVDVVGAVIGLHWVGPARIVASPLNLGTGTVRMAHGEFPVPPPATVRLVQGAPVYGAGEGEMLTPTGALIVTDYADSYGPLPPLRITAAGHGAGSRETARRPNVVRLLLGEEDAHAPSERVVVIETALDDLAPNLLAPVLERLLAVGALDAYFAPLVMKKGRPGQLLTVLCDEERRAAVEEVLFTETTTLGLRRSEWERSVLERASVPVDTAYGTVSVKIGRLAGQVVHAQPELEDCRRLAAERGVPLREVFAAAVAAQRSEKER
jgi:uncharacterized protein (TIGR00299 family) protein